MTDQHEAQTESPQQKPASRSSLYILFYVFILIALSIIAWMTYQTRLQLQQHSHTLSEIKQQSTSLATVQKQMDETQAALNTQKDTLTQLDAQVKDALAKSAQPETEQRIAEATHLIHLIEMQQTLNAPQKQIALLLEQLKMVFQNQSDSAAVDLAKFISDSVSTSSDVDVSDVFNQLSGLETVFSELDLRLLLSSQSTPETKPVTTDSSWWKIGLEKSWNILRHVVTVQKLEHSEKPLIFPEEKSLLMQNIRANLSFAKWGLLHQQQTIYETSLNEISQWVNVYFDLTQEKTKTVLAQLQSLKSKNIIPNLVDTASLKTKLNEYQQSTRAQHSAEQNRS